MTSGIRTGRARWLGALSVGVAVVMATPNAAVAADNLPPLQPVATDLTTSSKACVAGDGRPYVRGVPRVAAVLHDPVEDDRPAEGNFVTAEFEAWWTDGGGVEQRRSYHSLGRVSSGSAAEWQLPSDLPPWTVVSWRVRAHDGDAVSPWSAVDDEGAGCEFVIDNVSPEKPTVTSAEYPEEGGWSDGVGVYGTFRFDSPSDDVVSYTYDFVGGPRGTVQADGLGGAAEIRYMPTSETLGYLQVQADDRSGHRSPPTNYFFRVKAGRSPFAQWALSDPAGSKSAAPTAGPAARAGAGVAFGGPVPPGTALTSTATLDGTGHGFLTPGTQVVDTGKTFAVGGWVRPAALDHDMTLASQDAGTAPGFTLGARTGDGAPVWSFGIGGTRVSGGRPETGEWAYVLGLYDAETGLARLYVNGQEAGTATEAAPATVTGDFQIGRARGKAGYRDRWQGEIGDVRTYDRVVVPAEAKDLGRRTPQERGHWSLETAPQGLSPELHGGQALKFVGGASAYNYTDQPCDPEADPACEPSLLPYPLVGFGHLDLDGTSGYAATDSPVVDTGDSFTVAAVVNLADREPARPMTVLSQGGEHGDAFKVRYVPSTQTFELVMSHADAPDAAETVAVHSGEPDWAGGRESHLAVVHDRGMDRITLYVNGVATADAAFRSAWTSTGGLQVGRGRTADGWGEYLHGSVDEVQAFSGALSATSVSLLGFGGEPCLTC
ncbi:LamG domain-containing protein [Streptomyces sp. NBC_01013]|uniref:LamG domain-containing protein n=1 Tax=Streptomyces sp. NBC_01013 TaxID=2903718 RepID=UPI0038631091|nr:LamG domain-containing protein [Streptomyces sp. NBC_01013]